MPAKSQLIEITQEITMQAPHGSIAEASTSAGPSSATPPSPPHSAKQSGKKGGRQPLRRGDACLMCRAKKLRCSAHKPTCLQCSKRDDRCVYDSVRPPTRVEMLEQKLAEMDAERAEDNTSDRRISSEWSAARLPIRADTMEFPGHFAPGPTTDGQIQGTLESYAPGSQILPIMADNPNRPQRWAWSHIQPMLGLTEAEEKALQAQHQAQQAPPDNSLDPVLQEDALGWSVPAGSSNWINPLDGSSTSLLEPIMFPGQLWSAAPEPVMPLEEYIPPAPQEYELPQYENDTARAVAEIEVLVKVSQTRELCEGDISLVVQDLLLDMFFAPPHEPQGFEPFSAEQFKLRLASTLPKPGTSSPESTLSTRPLPALVFAMYSSAAATSYVPSVREISDAMLNVAERLFQEAIKKQDRLLDALCAGAMITKGMYSKSRALEGYQVAWQCASLVMACQLHQIPTGIYLEEEVAKASPDTWPLIGPPKDQVDLGHRIHVFWGLWGNDRGSGVMVPWPCAYRDEEVTTPFGRPLPEYASGQVASLPDARLSDLYRDSEKLATLDRPYNYVLLVAHLVQRTVDALKRRNKPHPSYRAAPKASTSYNPDSGFSLRRDDRELYDEIMDAAYVLKDLVERKFPINHDRLPAWTDPNLPSFHSALRMIIQLLHDPSSSDSEERSMALECAADFVLMGRLRVRQKQYDDQLRFTDTTSEAHQRGTMRHLYGLAGPYAMNGWYWTIDRLFKGAGALLEKGFDANGRDCVRYALELAGYLGQLGMTWRLTPDQQAIIDKFGDV